MNDKYYISEYDTPLGRVYMAADEIGLVGLWFENQKYFAKILGGAEAIERAIEEELSCDETCKGDGDTARDETCKGDGDAASSETCKGDGDVTRDEVGGEQDGDAASSETCKRDGEAACDEVGGEQAGCAASNEASHNEVSKLPVFEQTRRWLDIYFEGREPDFTPSLHLIGTDFRKEVWDILKQIPYGQTMTYGEIAEELAKHRGIRRMSAQAVGGAVGHNNISIIVPCHRVIGADGSLTGYAGGTDIKEELLRLEGAQWKV